MPARSQEEKERRRREYEERKQARTKSKQSQDTTTCTKSTKKVINYKNITPYDANSTSPLIHLSNDTLFYIFTFLPCRELTATCISCRYLYNVLNEHGRIAHLLCRLRTGNMELLQDELYAKEFLDKSSITNVDRYFTYARYVESSIGYEVMGKVRLPHVNGRIASVSPEHTLCRIGGGEASGGGGSGVFSMGVGKRGQLGNGKREDEKDPFILRHNIGYGIRIVQVSAGGGLVRVAHSLLLTSTGRVLSFGMAQYGQLGHGYSAGKQLSDVLHPKYIEALDHLKCICVAAGELHSAVVTEDGDVYTWGDGFCGQLGLGDKRPQMLPVQVRGGLEEECVESVSCGARHTLCVTEDGEVFSFGLGYYGVLGRSYTPFEYDIDVEDLVDDTMLARERNQPNGIDVQEQLSLIANVTLDDNSNQCYPQVLESLKGIQIIGSSAGHRHSMLLDTHGNLYTFGSGQCGALGHGDYIKQEYPIKIAEFASNDVKIKQFSAGVDISMAVSTTGDVYAWGKTDNGRIGLGLQPMNVSLPRRVTLPEKCIDVECGYVHSLIITISGNVYMCGGVGVHGADDGDGDGYPKRLESSIWQRRERPQEEKKEGKWKKYGTYEVKGRRQMLADAERWS